VSVPAQGSNPGVVVGVDRSRWRDRAANIAHLQLEAPQEIEVDTLPVSSAPRVGTTVEPPQPQSSNAGLREGRQPAANKKSPPKRAFNIARK
jgi:hypothetical protein